MRNLRIFLITSVFLNATSVLATGTDAAQAAQATEIATALQGLGNKATTVKATPNTAPPVVAASTAAVTSLESAAKAALTQIESCASKTKIANTMCLESTSPDIGSFMAKYGALLQGAGQVVGSMVDQCSDLGKTIGAANMALGAFQVACSTAQAVCTSACTSLKPAAQTYLESANAAQGTGAQGAAAHVTNANAMVAKTEQAIANCASYSVKVESAIAAGILSLQAIMQAKQCEEKTADSGGVDCTNPKNAAYNQKSCMCTRNELPAAECQGVNITGVKPAPIEAPGKTGASIEGDGSMPSGAGGSSSSGTTSISGDAGGAGAPIGGGGGGVGGGGGPAGGAQDGYAGTRRLNTNILGGGFGGGGGGGYGSGPGYGETDPRLKAYAPGGAKDPNRSVAAQIAKEVTGQGGRSNWEKVRSRYIDNARKLMGR